MSGVRLSVVPPLDVAPSIPARFARGELWHAWRERERWEDIIERDLPGDLGELLLVLWCLHRFGGADSLLVAAVDREAHPIFSDALLEDVAAVAFAFGAGWSEGRSTVAAARTVHSV